MALNVSPSSYRFLTVFASNSEQRIAWLTALRSAIAAVSVRPSSVPPPPTPPPPTLPSSFSSVTPPPSNLSTIEDMFESIDNERQHQGLLHVSDLQTSRISACKTVEIAGLEGGGGGGGEDGWKWLSSDALSIHAEIKNYGSPTTSPSVSPRSSLVSSDLKEHYEQQHINFNRLHHYTPQFYRHNNNMQMSFPASKSNILEWRSAASSSSPPLLLNQEERNELLRFQSLPTSLKSRASSSSNSGDGDEQRDNDQEVEREVEEEEEDILSPYPTNDFGNRRATGTTDWDLNLSSSPKKQQQPYPPPTSMARSTSSRKSTATANASLSSSSSLGRSRRDNSDGGEVSRGGTVMSSSSSSSSASTSTRRNRLSSKKSVSNLKEAFKGSMKKMFLRKSKSIHTLKAGYDNNIGLGADNDDGALVHLTPSSSSPPSSGYRVGEYRMVMDDNDEGVSTLATGTSNTLPRASPKQGINYFESWEVKTAASAAIKSDSLLPPFTTARESISHMSTASGAPSKTFAVVDDRASSTDSHLLRQQHQNSSSFDKIDDNSNCKNNNASDSASNYVLDFYLKEKSFESDCEELLKSFSGDFGSTKTLSGNVASTIPEIITPPKASAATNITSSTLAVAANMTDADLESNPVQALEQLLQADRSSSTPSDPQSVRSKLSVYGKNAVSGLIDDYFQ